MTAPKYRTVAIDAGNELARLMFAHHLNKHASDTEKMVEFYDYRPIMQKMAMITRRMKDFKARGIEVVVITNEIIQKVYPKGKFKQGGGPPPDPISVSGVPDFPGEKGPGDVAKVFDNVFRMTVHGGKEVWVCKRHSIGPGCGNWEVGERAGLITLNQGILPPSYEAISKVAEKQLPAWNPPYLWLIYGIYKIGKTRSLLSFPRPLLVLDVDRGADSIEGERRADPEGITIKSFNSEEMDDWGRFVATFESALGG